MRVIGGRTEEEKVDSRVKSTGCGETALPGCVEIRVELRSSLREGGGGKRQPGTLISDKQQSRTFWNGMVIKRVGGRRGTCT